jgi:hypothetical protein
VVGAARRLWGPDGEIDFGCLQGLHRQLLGARRHYLEWAGQLYARAYEPIRSGSPAAPAGRLMPDS